MTGLLATCFASYADEIQFTASPRYCPAEGPNAQCAKSLVLKWNANPVNRYCLLTKELSDPIECWENPTNKEIVFEYPDKLTQSVQFFLVVTSSEKVQMKTLTVELRKPKNKIQKLAERFGLARKVSNFRFIPR